MVFKPKLIVLSTESITSFIITQRKDTHLARVKRATVSVCKHLGDGCSETPAEKACQTSGGNESQTYV